MILVLTSIPGASVPVVGVPHLDKLVHFTLYAVLGLLTARALARSGRAAPAAVMSAVGAIALFAALDEWHQQFVPGRAADVLDWTADLGGGTLALLLGVAPRVPRPESRS